MLCEMSLLHLVVQRNYFLILFYGRNERYTLLKLYCPYVSNYQIVLFYILVIRLHGKNSVPGKVETNSMCILHHATQPNIIHYFFDGACMV